MTPIERLEWLLLVAADLNLPANAARVAIALANYASSRTGQAFPGIDHLAVDTGLHRATVVRCLDALRRRGHLKKATGGGRGKATIWTLQTVAPTATESEAETVAETVAISSNTVANRPLNCRTAVRPQPGEPIEPGEPIRARANHSPGSDDYPSPDWLPCDVWERWLLHLSEKRRPMTPQTYAAQIRLLARVRVEHDVPELIETAIASGWLSINPPKKGSTYETPHDRIHRINGGDRHRPPARHAPGPEEPDHGETLDTDEWDLRG